MKTATIIHLPTRAAGERPCDSEAPRIGARVPPAVRTGWWRRLSPGQKTDLVLGAIITGILIAAALCVPEPHPFLH